MELASPPLLLGELPPALRELQQHLGRGVVVQLRDGPALAVGERRVEGHVAQPGEGDGDDRLVTLEDLCGTPLAGLAVLRDGVHPHLAAVAAVASVSPPSRSMRTARRSSLTFPFTGAYSASASTAVPPLISQNLVLGAISTLDRKLCTKERCSREVRFWMVPMRSMVRVSSPATSVRYRYMDQWPYFSRTVIHPLTRAVPSLSSDQRRAGSRASVRMAEAVFVRLGPEIDFYLSY